MALFIAPGSKEHIEKAIAKGVSITSQDEKLKSKLLAVYKGENARVWGLSERHKGRWKGLKQGDYVLFYASGTKTFTHLAKVAFTYPFDPESEKEIKEAERLAELIWGRDEEGKTWPLLIFLDSSSIKSLKLDLDKFKEITGIPPLGFNRVSEEKSKRLLEIIR